MKGIRIDSNNNFVRRTYLVGRNVVLAMFDARLSCESVVCIVIEAGMLMAYRCVGV